MKMYISFLYGLCVLVHIPFRGLVSLIFVSPFDLVQKEESFYTLSWTCKVDGSPLLVAGGINGVIRVIDIDSETIYKVDSIGKSINHLS